MIILNDEAIKNTILRTFSLLLLILFSGFTLNTSNVFKKTGTMLKAQPAGTSVSPPHVDSLLNEMTLEEKIGQLFFIRAYGRFLNKNEESFLELKRAIKEYHIGGITFFQGDIYNQAVLTNELQKLSKYPLWISQDMEYGAAMRVNGTTRFTPSMGVAATQNPDYAYHIGRITALEAQALGVHQIFAPVMDINNNPKNPVINVRSFGGTPDIVSQFGQKFIEGVQSVGLIATAKHFPGHGDTDTDSHTDLPVIKYNFSRLDSVEFVPFRQAINHNVQSIMTAHIALPEISGNIKLPSTLDRNILNHILTDSLNFTGLVVTDALEMKGVASHYSPGEAVIQSLKAGAHVMLLSPDIGTAVNEVRQAVKTGALSQELINNAVRRILSLKTNHLLFANRFVDLNRLNERIALPEHEIIAEEIARESITLLKNEGNILPVSAYKYPKVMVLSIADDASGTTGRGLARAVRRYHPDVTFRVFDRRTDTHEQARIVREARNADLVICGSFIFVQTGKEIQLSNAQRHFMSQIIETGTPTLLTAYGNPYVVQDIPGAQAHMMAWSGSENQVEASVQAMFGSTPVTGKIPISIPGMYAIGEGLELKKTILRRDAPAVARLHADTLRNIDRLMRHSIADSVFPGGVVAIARNGILAYEKAFGYHTYEKTTRVRVDDVYDLASLTKILATTPAIMKLIDDDKIDLDDKVGKYLPEFSNGDKKKLRIKNLLLHNSGLPPFKFYVDSLQSRDDILQAARNEALIAKPFEEYIYSDIGFMVLADIIEKVTGTRLDRFMQSEFYNPMDLHSMYFNPARLGSWMKRRIPPTEIDTLIRKDTVQAIVHDERAYFMDGVAGHAGLFSTAGDAAAFGQMLLNKGAYAGKVFIKPKTVTMFTGRQSNLNNRGYGFDRKSEGFSTAGTKTSMETFGHLGFTGTSLWVDPQHNLVIVLLTNRTYPHRSYGKNINTVRAQIADITISAITN